MFVGLTAFMTLLFQTAFRLAYSHLGSFSAGLILSLAHFQLGSLRPHLNISLKRLRNYSYCAKMTTCKHFLHSPLFLQIYIVGCLGQFSELIVDQEFCGLC
jgi:hypothetical protein